MPTSSRRSGTVMTKTGDVSQLPIREEYKNKINSPRGRPSMDLSTPFAATRPTRLLIDGTGWSVRVRVLMN